MQLIETAKITEDQRSALINDLSRGYESGTGMMPSEVVKITSPDALSTLSGRKWLQKVIYFMRGVSVSEMLARLTPAQQSRSEIG